MEDSVELSAEEKRQKIEELLYGKDDKKGKLTQMFRLSNYVQNLTEYTNLLAGKKAFADRNMEQQWGRITYDLSLIHICGDGDHRTAAHRARA